MTFSPGGGKSALRLRPEGRLRNAGPRLEKRREERSKSKLKTANSEANERKALMLDTIQRLRRDPDVVYAEANFIRKPFATPSDTHFPKQWHYELINLPHAWDTTIGSNNITVAVIDTGVLHHPDLEPRLVPGFDFISDMTAAGDGDGPDADATDEGDDPRKISSSFHGTHVAGTIGASTNNDSGVAGVTWLTRIMPLRVLGAGGGTDADIAQAILYAAGGEDLSVPKRAHIINMSLGGAGFSQTMQDAITTARNKGVIIVAAAGNENTSAFTSPAGLEGVISVARKRRRPSHKTMPLPSRKRRAELIPSWRGPIGMTTASSATSKMPVGPSLIRSP